MRTPLDGPGLLLGAGLGAFVDGIVLHQVLQWHHMLSGVTSPDTVPGLRMNTVADGVFHVAAWLFVLGGVALLARRGGRDRRVWAQRALWGPMLIGWGLFNLVEGLVDHHLLGVHHVREGPHRLAWDLGFLALGAVLVAAGAALRRGAAGRGGGTGPGGPASADPGAAARR